MSDVEEPGIRDPWTTPGTDAATTFGWDTGAGWLALTMITLALLVQIAFLAVVVLLGPRPLTLIAPLVVSISGTAWFFCGR